jgi:hypothetical protein
MAPVLFFAADFAIDVTLFLPNPFVLFCPKIHVQSPLWTKFRLSPCFLLESFREKASMHTLGTDFTLPCLLRPRQNAGAGIFSADGICGVCP